LLTLLWAEEARGTVGELASRAGVSAASAHVELNGLRRAQLVVSHREGNREVFAANLNHPRASTLRELVAAGPPPTLEGAADLKAKLRALGAPLRGVAPQAVSPPEIIEVLLQAVSLARHDPVVARALPLCVWRARHAINTKALQAQSLRSEDKHALGFFLELTGELGRDGRMLAIAESLRDGRFKVTRPFFLPARPRRVDDEPGFDLAAKWGFEMNMSRDSFQSLFDKFATRGTAPDVRE
jgi:hypothetical protein